MNITNLINSPERRHINSLSPDSSSTSNTCGVLTWSRVDDSIDNNLQGILTSQKMDDLERVFDNPDCHELLAVVPSVHHKGVNEALNNRALSLAETLGSISNKIKGLQKCKSLIIISPSSRVGKVLGILLLDCNVILEGHVGDLNILAAPLSKQLDLRELSHYGCWGLLNWGILGFLGPIVSHCGFLVLLKHKTLPTNTL